MTAEIFNTPAAPELKITIVHDDTVTGIQAMQVLAKLSEQLAFRHGLKVNPWRFQTRAWRFEWLQDPKLWTEAVEMAADADMIIVSAEACQELPSGVRSWIESVLPRKLSESSALVALLNDRCDECASKHSPERYLQQLAKHHGVDFFCNLENQPDKMSMALPQFYPGLKAS